MLIAHVNTHSHVLPIPTRRSARGKDGRKTPSQLAINKEKGSISVYEKRQSHLGKVVKVTLGPNVQLDRQSNRGPHYDGNSMLAHLCRVIE